MSEPQVVPDPHPHEERTQSDPVVFWLYVGVFFVIALAVAGILYVVLSGALNASTSAPRTLLESQLDQLRSAAQTYPGSGTARQAYILALAASGQNSAAMSEFNAALKQTTGVEQMPVYDAGVTVLASEKKNKEAIDLAKKGLASDDAVRKAIVIQEKGKGINVGNGSQLFDNAARESLLFTLARLVGEAGDWQGAVNYLTQDIQLDPTAADYLAYRAVAYTKLGNKAAAIADYKQALQFIPTYQPAISGLKALNATATVK